MTVPKSRKSAKEILDLYFIENRAKLLDIASFLDRIDRYEGAEAVKQDFRYKSLQKSVGLLGENKTGRAKAIQLICSDMSKEPIESAVGLIAFGAWEGMKNESH